MTDTDPPRALTADIVLALAELQGYRSLDADAAARIAVGASDAIRAVGASATLSLIDIEPGAFLAELERLAGNG